MILSVSRRTDIPNYYSEWFYNRIKEGYLYVRNPMNPHQISRINISPDFVDCIVFWTKNPANMIPGLSELKDYKYYFQFTLTCYGKDIEPGIPNKRNDVINTFKNLSEKIGTEKVIWRYDPIIFNEKYSMEYHLKAFEEIADNLNGYTKKVIISFIDIYAKTKRNTKGLNIQEIKDDKIIELAGELGKIAKKYHLGIETCAEHIDLNDACINDVCINDVCINDACINDVNINDTYINNAQIKDAGIKHGSCIDKELIESIIGCRLKVNKDKNQRKECGCIESVEVGTYNTCKNGCKYCYANFNEEKVKESIQLYNVNSPLLCGNVQKEDKITERKVKSLKVSQISLPL